MIKIKNLSEKWKKTRIKGFLAKLRIKRTNKHSKNIKNMKKKVAQQNMIMINKINRKSNKQNY